LNVTEDEENPEFCPLRHLLIYIYLIKIKDGHLFPPASVLNSLPQNGFFKEWMTYDSFNNNMTATLRLTLGAEDGSKWGTHTCRKTAYLIAIWGGGSVESIMASARHNDVASAQRYVLDSHSQLTIAEAGGKLWGGQKSKWKPIILKNVKAAAKNSTLASKGSLLSIATYYVENICDSNSSRQSGQSRNNTTLC
jgi:hypothetical protein